MINYSLITIVDNITDFLKYKGLKINTSDGLYINNEVSIIMRKSFSKISVGICNGDWIIFTLLSRFRFRGIKIPV